MTIEVVFFDFSSTLFRLDPNEAWLAELIDLQNEPLDLETQTELRKQMVVPDREGLELDAEFQQAWENRDLDSASHRKAFLEVYRQSGVTDIKYATAFYERMLDPHQWLPYLDTEMALKTVKNQGLHTAVISNIPFDIRPAFLAHQLDSFIDEFILSFEIGVMKPNPAIFQLALDKFGIAPENALMIGDNKIDDGGAQALGCGFAFVEPISIADRPNGLLTALRAHGIY